MVRWALPRVAILVADALDHHARKMRREPEAFLVGLIGSQCEGVDQEHLDEMMVHLLVLESVQAIFQQFDAAIMIPPDQASFFHALERAVDRAMTYLKLLR